MIKAKTIIIGGGASGLLCAVMHDGSDVIVLERGERVGRKLSATGNGQGNVTNVGVSKERYFSVNGDCGIIEKTLCSSNGYEGMLALLEDLGGCFMPDAKGRVYPTGKQASAVTDLLRYRLDYEGKKMVTGAFVTSVKKKGNEFVVETDGADGKTSYSASNVVVATGGKASKNFGTDGNGYLLIKSFGHTVTPLYPSLVQIKTEVKDIKTLKGIRVYSKIQAYLGAKKLAEETGDVIFADYGVSGDAVFRL
ncbi:MAG: NAD(P)/FAD-dependent oxidoreductase, partial [Clostridia bacterium]|nr:NAD(P)/FAD-dependent oxidoreductase [Clostridia bacterium]